MSIIITLAVLAIALIVGQRLPIAGAFIATLPVKSLAYALNAADPTFGKAMIGLAAGSLGSASFAVAAMICARWFSPALSCCAGLIAWAGVAFIAWRFCR